MTTNNNQANSTGAKAVKKVLIIARISTEKQDARSLDDQVAFCRNWVEQNLEGPFEYIIEKSQGSGENLERPELTRFDQLIRSGQITHVVCEESSRHCRRSYSVMFCELCEDYGVRFVAINDHIDTSTDWRLHSMFSSMKHEMSNMDTSNRIRRSLRNRFSQGGIVQYQSFGHIKPPGAKHDSELRLDQALVPIVKEVFCRIEAGASYCEVADWLNSQNVPVAKHARTLTWDNAKVRRMVTDPIYKGVRERNRKKSLRVNSSGRRKSVNAPREELLVRQCPHLTIIEPDRFDRINAMLKLRNDKYCRGRQAAGDSRKGQPRKRTAWPGQHVRCGLCKHLLYWGGHGQKDRMMCSGCRQYLCWNAASCSGLELAQRVTEKALDLIERLPEYSIEFLKLVKEELKLRQENANDAIKMLQNEISTLEPKIANVTNAIATLGISPALTATLLDLERQRSLKQTELDTRKLEDKIEVEMPSMLELKQLARQCLGEADFKDPETYRLLSQLFPGIEVYPYMLIDGGSVVLRAHVTIHLDALKPQTLPPEMCSGLLKHDFVVDLFEPPQRVKVLNDVPKLLAAGHSKKEVARRLEVAPLVIDQALALRSMMEQQGVVDPYGLLTLPPEKSKIKRHEHPRFKPGERAAG
ncbi:MAG: recombinase family protein [Gemmatales bacterium]